MPRYQSTKTYGTDRGLSCCFRQWRSTHSHCSLLHGYSIGIRLVFESETLDSRNWVMDFGGLSAFKSWAEYMFDHTLVVAQDDPHLDKFLSLATLGLQDQGGVCDVRIVPAVGCEKFSELVYNTMNDILQCYKRGEAWEYRGAPAHGAALAMRHVPRYPVGQDVRLVSAEVFEHAGNSAIYLG